MDTEMTTTDYAAAAALLERLERDIRAMCATLNRLEGATA